MINIDAEIYSEFYYNSLDSELGNEIKQNIHWGEDSFFKLTSSKICFAELLELIEINIQR